MLVDESDNYKNLFLYTKMRNVAGLSSAEAQKSSDMFAKCRYLDEITGCAACCPDGRQRCRNGPSRPAWRALLPGPSGAPWACRQQCGIPLPGSAGPVLRHWQDGENEKLTQLVFSDISTPTAGKGGFNIYDDIKTKLAAAGMPLEQVAFIHDAATDEQKKVLFAKVRSGQVRVLIGSTQKMGAGTNIQDRLIASHDLDAPWRPRDLTQRAGRIIRQGNDNEKDTGVPGAQGLDLGEGEGRLVHVLAGAQGRPAGHDLGDEFLLGLQGLPQIGVEGRFGHITVDVDLFVIISLPIKERMELDVEVARLRIMKADYQSKKFRLEDSVMKRFPAEIEQTEAMASRAWYSFMCSGSFARALSMRVMLPVALSPRSIV